MRLLGIDLGDKTVGLSLSDTTWTIASPYQTLARSSDQKAIDDLKKVIQEFSIMAIVMGYPLNMNGSAGPQSQKVVQFSEKLLTNHKIPLLLWDERLSTAAVTRTLITADVSRKKQKKAVDKLAATFILQGVLDSLNF
ncbi:Holliday junction resolvase RuvX [Candidatus Finniella inopinata]|uniref:Putative pre-16S rRNA nuclease n=2 Tax=Candidatus Finniella inopinata TaxID=1696036 RepID=A0A4Q7DJS8_9PROT|nr:Holliday junction resolvase RuvX [Candidatus Finniella inopinata]